MHLLGLLVEVLHQVLNLVELDDHHLDGRITEGHVGLSNTSSEFHVLVLLLLELPGSETLHELTVLGLLVKL